MMRRNLAQFALLLTLGLALGDLSTAGYADKNKSQDLAAAAQNSIASMISLPFQNNTYFNIDPANETANSLLIQPVYPISLTEGWNVIMRAIVPLIYVEGFHASNPHVPNTTIEVDDTFGLGDINLTAYFSPKKLINLGGGKFTWGLGPSITFDSSTDRKIGCPSRKLITLEIQHITSARNDDEDHPLREVQLPALFLDLESVADQVHPSPMKDVFANGDNKQDNLI